MKLQHLLTAAALLLAAGGIALRAILIGVGRPWAGRRRVMSR